MRQKGKLSAAQKSTIEEAAAKTPVKQLAEKLNTDIRAIYNFCYRNGIVLRQTRPKKKSVYKGFMKKETEMIIEAKMPFRRPLAVYTNRTPYGFADEMRSHEFRNRVIL